MLAVLAEVFNPYYPDAVIVMSWKKLAEGPGMWMCGHEKELGEEQGNGKVPSWQIQLRSRISGMTHHECTEMIRLSWHLRRCSCIISTCKQRSYVLSMAGRVPAPRRTLFQCSGSYSCLLWLAAQGVKEDWIIQK